MAEVIGLISGLYTIGKAGLCLYDTLTVFAEGIKTADRDVTLVAFEIKSTSEILLLIRDSLQDSKESKSQIIKQSRLILEGLATQCEFCHDLIKDLICFLRPYFDESKASQSKELVRFGHRIKHVKLLDKWRWQQQRPKVDKLRSYLEALKSNLGLVLPILHYQIAEKERAPSVTLQSLKDTIEVALREARSHPSNLTQELAKDAEATRPTSMAVTVCRNRSDTPQAVAQDLAADILCSDRQRRPYIGQASEANGPDLSYGGLDDEYQRLNLSEQGGISLRSKVFDSGELHDTTNGIGGRQSSRQNKPPARHSMSDDDRDDLHPHSSKTFPIPFPAAAPNSQRISSFQREGADPDNRRSLPQHQGENELNRERFSPGTNYKYDPIRHRYQILPRPYPERLTSWKPGGRSTELSMLSRNGAEEAKEKLAGQDKDRDSTSGCTRASLLEDSHFGFWRSGVGKHVSEDSLNHYHLGESARFNAANHNGFRVDADNDLEFPRVIHTPFSASQQQRQSNLSRLMLLERDETEDTDFPGRNRERNAASQEAARQYIFNSGKAKGSERPAPEARQEPFVTTRPDGTVFKRSDGDSIYTASRRARRREREKADEQPQPKEFKQSHNQIATKSNPSTFDSVCEFLYALKDL